MSTLFSLTLNPLLYFLSNPSRAHLVTVSSESERYDNERVGGRVSDGLSLKCFWPNPTTHNPHTSHDET